MFDRRVMLALPLGLMAACKGGGSTPTGGVAGLEAEGDMTMGDPNAKVKMVEYHSVACPVCAQFATTVWPEFKAKYIDTGKVHYTSREALTHSASLAAAGFLVAHCAGKDKYFEVVDTLYRRQGELESPVDGSVVPNVREKLLEIARTAGLTEAQFNACVSDEAALDKIQRRWEQYISDGIDSTPYITINGKQVASWDLASLSAAVDAALK